MPPRIVKPAPPAEAPWGRTKTVDLGLFTGKKPVYVGIDQSLTNFGMAAYSPKDDTAFLWLYQPKRKGVQRLLDIQFFVRGVIQQISLGCGVPGHIVMEDYAYSRQMGHALGECGAATKIALINTLGICEKVAYPTIAGIQQAKKFATGSGAAKKDKLQLTVYKKWKVDASDENLADAYIMSRMAAAIETGATDYEYERLIIGALKEHTEWPTPDPTRPTGSSRRARKPSSG